MTANAKAMAVRPALERRWDDALASFDTRTEIGVLGVPGRADTVEELGELLRSRGVEPLRWYGVWLFVDWLGFSGAELDPGDAEQVAATAAVALEPAGETPTASSVASSISWDVEAGPAPAGEPPPTVVSERPAPPSARPATARRA